MLVHRPPSDKGEEMIEVELQKKSGKGAGLCLTGYKSGKGAYVSDLVRSLVFLTIINYLFFPSFVNLSQFSRAMGVKSRLCLEI